MYTDHHQSLWNKIREPPAVVFSCCRTLSLSDIKTVIHSYKRFNARSNDLQRIKIGKIETKEPEMKDTRKDLQQKIFNWFIDQR